MCIRIMNTSVHTQILHTHTHAHTPQTFMRSIAKARTLKSPATQPVLDAPPPARAAAENMEQSSHRATAPEGLLQRNKKKHICSGVSKRWRSEIWVRRLEQVCRALRPARLEAVNGVESGGKE